jgi:hypothetical protein
MAVGKRGRFGWWTAISDKTVAWLGLVSVRKSLPVMLQSEKFIARSILSVNFKAHCDRRSTLMNSTDNLLVG